MPSLLHAFIKHLLFSHWERYFSIWTFGQMTSSQNFNNTDGNLRETLAPATLGIFLAGHSCSPSRRVSPWCWSCFSSPVSITQRGLIGTLLVYKHWASRALYQFMNLWLVFCYIDHDFCLEISNGDTLYIENINTERLLTHRCWEISAQ